MSISLSEPAMSTLHLQSNAVFFFKWVKLCSLDDMVHVDTDIGRYQSGSVDCSFVLRYWMGTCTGYDFWKGECKL